MNDTIIYKDFLAKKSETRIEGLVFMQTYFFFLKFKTCTNPAFSFLMLSNTNYTYIVNDLGLFLTIIYFTTLIIK